MFFRQFYDEGLAQASYLIGCETTGEALVVDPRRDIDVYLEAAAAHKLRIIAVAETHIHADYLSGGRELAAATGTTLHVSGHGDADSGYIEHQAGVRVAFVRDGDEIRLGAIRARVMHTPGHTPEHISFAIYDGDDKTQPMLLLSGDFMFVGDLGRPDLLEETLGQAGAARLGARAMFATLKSVLAALPDFVQIWPAHGAGSACGKALGAIPSSTLGYERRFSWWSRLVASDDEEGFIAALLEGQPDAPTYFARMKHLNRGLTPILGSLPRPKRLDAQTLRAVLSGGAVLVDTRMRDAFCSQHVQGAISVPDRPSFSTRSAWFAAPDRPIVLLAKPERVEDLVRKLVRVGLDDIAGYVAEVAEAQMPTESVPQVALDEAKRRWSSDEATVLDVRQRGEFAEAHIPHALNVSAGSLVAKVASVPKDRPVLVVCAGGDRSVAASSVLAALGFDNVTNLTEGFDSWRAQGLPVESGLVRS